MPLSRRRPITGVDVIIYIYIFVRLVFQSYRLEIFARNPVSPRSLVSHNYYKTSSRTRVALLLLQLCADAFQNAQFAEIYWKTYISTYVESERRRIDRKASDWTRTYRVPRENSFKTHRLTGRNVTAGTEENRSKRAVQQSLHTVRF